MSKDSRVEELKRKAIEMELLALNFKFPSFQKPKTRHPSKRRRR